MHGESRLRGLEHCERSAGTTEVEQATTIGGDMLVVAGAGAEEVAELVIASAEPLRRDEALEAAHASCAPFHAPMILPQPVVFVGAGPVHDPPPERAADRPRVGAMPVGGDLIGRHTRGGLGRAEEGPGRRHVAVMAQHRVDEVAVAVDGSVEIRPPAADLQVRFIHVPAPAAGSAPAVPPPAESGRSVAAAEPQATQSTPPPRPSPEPEPTRAALAGQLARGLTEPPKGRPKGRRSATA